MNYHEVYTRAKVRLKKELIAKLGMISDQKFFLDSHMVEQQNDGISRVDVYSNQVQSDYLLPAKSEVTSNFYPKRYVYKIESASVDPLSGFIYNRDGHFIAESSSWNPLRLFYSWPKPTIKKPKNRISDQCIFLPNIGYYHWLIEDLPAFIGALTRYPNATIIIPEKVPSFADSFISSLDREIKRISKPVIIEELIMVGKTAGQGSPYTGLTPHPEDIKTLKAYFQKYIESRKAQNLNLYLSRKGYSRCPANEEDIQSFLSSKGFIIFNAQNGLSFFEQIKLFSQAKNIIGLHGAALANTVWCHPNTNILELFSSNYIPPCFSNIASIGNLNYNFSIYGKDTESSIDMEIIKNWLKKTQD